VRSRLRTGSGKLPIMVVWWWWSTHHDGPLN
jgi:hypothetical protein